MIRRLRIAIDELKWARSEPHPLPWRGALLYAWNVLREGL